MKLRWHLVVLVLAAVLPLLVFTVIMVGQHLRLQHDVVERGMRDTVRALSLAVDREVKTSWAVLETLAASPSLEAGDLKRFHETCVRAMEGRPDSRAILFDRSGQQLVNSDSPFGASLPNPFRDATPPRRVDQYSELPIGGSAPVKKAFETGRPVVSDLFVGLDANRPTIGVDIPVVQNGEVRYVLEMSIDPEVFTKLLLDHHPTADSPVVIVDGRGVVVARTLNPGRIVGRLAALELRGAMAASDDGWITDRNQFGIPVYRAFTRSSVTGWTTTMAVSQTAVTGSMRRSIAILTGGASILLLFGLLAAVIRGKRITAPISVLARSAVAIARGEPIEVPAAAVEEIKDLGDALVAGGEAARDAAAERGRRLVAEAKRMEAEAVAAAMRARDETQGQLAAIVEASSDGIMSFTLDGVIRTWNPAAARLYGYSPEDIRGRHVSLLVPAARTHEPAELFAGVARGESLTLETVRLRKDGTTVQVALTVSPVRNSAGEVTGVSAAVRDISQQKRAEAALKAANQAKDAFLAMLGHELRNPLGAIASAVTVLNVAGVPEPAAERARAVIGRQVQHLSRLVDDLLDVSRVTTGKVILDRRPFDLTELVAKVLSAWQASGRFDRHHVSVDLRSVWVDADEIRIEQVLSNLVGNALKYTPPAGSVTIRVAHDGGTALLEVADTGIGISTPLMDKVFELFMQGDRALDRAQGGLGIGLTLVKALVEMHGGRVEAASEGQGRGAVFTVRLPRVPAAVTPDDRATSAVPARPGRRILIVEDNDDAREMLRVQLTQDGHEVHEAADGPTAVEMAAAHVPDVALIDIGLPGLDGYEVARRIRAGTGGKSIFLVAMTGYGQLDDRRRAFEAGFDAHATKPVLVERLAELIAAGPRDRLQ